MAAGGVPLADDPACNLIQDVDSHMYRFIMTRFDKRTTEKLVWDSKLHTVNIHGLDDSTRAQLVDEVKRMNKRVIDIDEKELETARIIVREKEQDADHSHIEVVLNAEKAPRELVIVGPNDAVVSNYEHKVKLKLGRFRETNRRHDSCSTISSHGNDKMDATDSRANDTYTHFITHEKITVHVGKVDITDMGEEVQCIVNPINIENTHNGLVSQAIRKVSGDAYAEIIEGVHDIDVTKCQVTSGGDLKTEYVMHAVCPKKPLLFGSSLLRVDEHIFETVENCLMQAEEKMFSSIAFPTLCAGRRGISILTCSKQYANAILEFSRKRKNIFAVTDVYFVDICDEHIEVLLSTFRDCFAQDTYHILEIPKVQPISMKADFSVPKTQLMKGYADIEVHEGNLGNHTSKQANEYAVSGSRESDTQYESITPTGELSDNKLADPQYENVSSLKIQESGLCSSDGDGMDNKEDELEGCVDVKEDISADCDQLVSVNDNELEGCVDIKEDTSTGYEQIESVNNNELEGCVDAKEQTATDQSKDEATRCNYLDDAKNDEVKNSSELGNGRHCKIRADENDDNDNYSKIRDSNEKDTVDDYDTLQDSNMAVASEELLSNKFQETTENVTDSLDKTNIETSDSRDVVGERVIVRTRSRPDDTMNVPLRVSALQRQNELTSRFKVNNGCIIFVYQDDIRNIRADAIVCPEKISSGAGGFMAAAIKARFRQSFRAAKLEKLRKSKHIAVTERDPNYKDVKYILHTRTPFCSEYPGSEDKFRTELTLCLPEVFKKIDRHNKERKVDTVAFPLMGIDSVQDETIVLVACRVLVESVIACCDWQKTVQQIHLVNTCPTITEWLTKLVDQIVTSRTSRELKKTG